MTTDDAEKKAHQIIFLLIQVSLIFHLRLAVVCWEVFSFQKQVKLCNFRCSTFFEFLYIWLQMRQRKAAHKIMFLLIQVSLIVVFFCFFLCKVDHCLLRNVFNSKASQKTKWFQRFIILLLFFLIFVDLTANDAEKSSSSNNVSSNSSEFCVIIYLIILET